PLRWSDHLHFLDLHRRRRLPSCLRASLLWHPRSLRIHPGRCEPRSGSQVLETYACSSRYSKHSSVTYVGLRTSEKKSNRIRDCFVSNGKSAFNTAKLANAPRLSREPAVDDPQSCDNRYGEINSNDSTDCSANHHSEYRQEGMDLQFVSHDPRGDRIIH